MPVRDSPPQPVLPLQGVTILAVEDSRYASEALRLMAQRAGARLRRAETLRAARWHLATYRPDAVLVDMGLPDGSGADLIRDLAGGGGPAVIALSGDPGLRGAAMVAGAALFLEKPLEGLALFQTAILRHLPDRPPVVPLAPERRMEPDQLALREDLVAAARLLDRGPDAAQRAYLAQFLGGIARSTRDAALARAAAGLPQADAGRIADLCGLVALRIGEAPRPFA